MKNFVLSALLFFLSTTIDLSGKEPVETQVFELAQDMVITGKDNPFKTKKSLSDADSLRVVITSLTGKKVIIDEKSTWNLKSFENKKCTIEFSGNVQLVCRNGAKIKAHGCTIRFKDSSRLVLDKGAQ